MLRFLLLLCAALTSVLVLAGGAGSAQSGSQGAENLAAGTGTLNCTAIAGATCTGVMLHVNAQSGAGGVSPRGHFWIRYPSGVEFGGSIVCLNVTATNAALTGRIDRVKVANPSLGFVLGNFVPIRITDNGSPGTLDLVNFDRGVDVQPEGCTGAGDIPISQGNYIVHDEPVLDLSALNLLLAQFEAEANDPYGG
jgi:hypothetical protein